MIGALPFIALAVGATRVVRGVKIQHVCGDPRLPREEDEALSLRIVRTALRALHTQLTGPTLFEPLEREQEEIHA